MKSSSVVGNPGSQTVIQTRNFGYMVSLKTKRNKSAPLVYWVIGAITIAGVIFMLWLQDDIQIKLMGDLRLSDYATDLVNSYLEWLFRL